MTVHGVAFNLSALIVSVGILSGVVAPGAAIAHGIPVVDYLALGLRDNGHALCDFILLI